MIKALTGVISMVLAAMSVVAQPATTVDPAEGTSSTPARARPPAARVRGVSVHRSWAVQPFFDLAQAVATEEVTIRAGSLTKRNFALEVVGRSHGRAITRVVVAQIRQLALPFGHYRNATFIVRQSTKRARLPRSWLSSSSPASSARRPTRRGSPSATSSAGPCGST